MVNCDFKKQAEVLRLKTYYRCTKPGPYKGHVCEVVRQAGHCPGPETKGAKQ